MLAEEIKIPLADMELTALRYGKPDRPVIFAVHGWLDNDVATLIRTENLQ